MSGRTFGRTSGGDWRDWVVTALMLAFGAGAIAMIFRIDEQRRVGQARVLLDGDMSPAEVVREVGADWLDLNEKAPGSAVDVSAHVGSKPHTIVVWASGHCSVSATMVRCLQRLVCLRRDCAVRHVEIDRPGAGGIDWESPACAPVPAPRAVPYLEVYDGSGQRVAAGKVAKALVKSWYDATLTPVRALP